MNKQNILDNYNASYADKVKAETATLYEAFKANGGQKVAYHEAVAILANAPLVIETKAQFAGAAATLFSHKMAPIFSKDVDQAKKECLSAWASYVEAR